MEQAQRERDLVGHTSFVTACAITPDGERIVSASYDHSLRVWDLNTGEVVAVLQGHTDKVLACAVMPDGRCVSASADKTLKVWNVVSGEPIATLRSHADKVLACAVMPDGRCVSASADKTLTVWDVASGQPVATLQGHAARVTSCAVTPDGRRVVSASEDRTLRVWDVASGQAVAILQGHRLDVTACAVTPDGRRVVSASYDTTIRVWDLVSGQSAAPWQCHAGFVLACAVTPDGRHVVSASEDKTLKVWDLDTGQPVATLHGHASFVTACAVTPDGRRVVSASCDKTLKVWDLDAEQLAATPHDHAASAIPDGRRVVSLLEDQAPQVQGRHGHHQLGFLQGNEPPEPRWRMKHTILFVAANPLGTDQRALQAECAAIESELLGTEGGRDDFDFRSKWDVSVDALMRHLNELQPTILHVSGYGSIGAASSSPARSGPHCDTELPRGAGIMLRDDGGSQYVSESALADMIATAAQSTRVVVLNACFSAAVADSLRRKVGCVVGMDGAIGDVAARSFAVAFYRALGNRRSVGNAVEQANATLAAKQLPTDLVVCRTRDGLRADQIFLHTSDPRRAPTSG